MSLASYSDLTTAVANWLDNDSLTSRIPEFITLAEARFNRVLRAPDMLTRNDSFTIDGQYETLPTGFLEQVRVSLLTSPVTPLQYITPEEMDQKRSVHSGNGRPMFFTVSGGNFEFCPTPDSAYTGSVLYYAALTTVSSSFNWLATSHPDIYLWGALIAAEAYIRNDERLPVWKVQLDEALAELKMVNERKKTGGAVRPRLRGGFS